MFVCVHLGSCDTHGISVALPYMADFPPRWVFAAVTWLCWVKKPAGWLCLCYICKMFDSLWVMRVSESKQWSGSPISKKPGWETDILRCFWLCEWKMWLQLAARLESSLRFQKRNETRPVGKRLLAFVWNFYCSCKCLNDWESSDWWCLLLFVKNKLFLAHHVWRFFFIFWKQKNMIAWR